MSRTERQLTIDGAILEAIHPFAADHEGAEDEGHDLIHSIFCTTCLGRVEWLSDRILEALQDVPARMEGARAGLGHEAKKNVKEAQ